MNAVSPSPVWWSRKSEREPEQLVRTLGFVRGEQLRTEASQEPAGCCSLSRGEKFQDLPFLSSLFLLNPQSGFLGETKLPGRQEGERERGLGKLVTLVVMAASSCAGFCPLLSKQPAPTIVWGSPATADLGCSKFSNIFSLILLIRIWHCVGFCFSIHSKTKHCIKYKAFFPLENATSVSSSFLVLCRKHSFVIVRKSQKYFRTP